MIEKVVSGGQSGVDRAALDAALELGLPCGGWCPSGRLAEDGPLDRRYPLSETPSANYAQRTEWNVRDSDGTLILHSGEISGGTAFTLALARRQERPHLILDLTRRLDREEVSAWAKMSQVRVLNVAGPRESGCPGIYQQARKFIADLLAP